MLEAVSDAELRVWGLNVGNPVSMIDLSILDVLSIVDPTLTGKIMPDFSYEVNRRVCGVCFYLVEGIYLKWPMFVTAYPRR